MKNAKIEQLVLGMVSTNVWLIKNKETGEILIVDPADRPGQIQRRIQQMEGKPVAILLTHGHFDHIMAATELRRIYQIPVYAHEFEKAVLTDSRYNLSGSWAKAYTMEADQWVKDNEILELAGFEIQVMHTPGHTPGGCCYYIEEESILISGDTLFAESVGRTDFPGSSGQKMWESLHRLLRELPEDTGVYPGHGEETTIGHEKRYNPFA